MASFPRASSFDLHSEGRLLNVHLNAKRLAPVRTLTRGGSPMTIRGGGVPYTPWLQCRFLEWSAASELSLPMRKAASWLGSVNPPNTRLRHDDFVRHTRASWPAVSPLPVPTPTLPINSVFSCPSPASPRSPRSRTTRSTSRPPADCTSSTSSCSRTTKTGAPTPSGKPSTSSWHG